MKYGAVFWGTLAILAGAALTAGNLLGVNVWPFLWPVALIFIGVWFLIWARIRPAASAVEAVTIPLQGASRADVRIRHGAGRLLVREGAGSNALAEGSFTGGLRHTEYRQGDLLDAELRVPDDVWMNFGGPWIFGPWTPIVWDMRLNESIPMTLDLETGAGESRLDFSTLKAEDIRLKTGASSTEMTLPARAGKIRVQVSSGAASVVLRIPDGVAARIAVESGLAGISVDQNRFPRSGKGYQSADFDRAENAADIRIETGVGAVEIR
ncbi:MAG: hypothetical protein JW929_13000 [Anaerolineales bacterium]|nr:hypothetical protein [Anaerolineales bacterium]